MDPEVHQRAMSQLAPAAQAYWGYQPS